MDDLSLRRAVEEELEFDPAIEAANIGVTVENGVVTLTGHVNSYAEKIAAEHAAAGVEGVRGIAQELAVRYPNHKRTADDEIAQRALRIIDWDAALPDGGVKVRVQNGVVTLSGEVEWGYQRAAAEQAVRRLSGVVGINNAITVRPRAETSDVRERIERALVRNAELAAEGIHVEVKDGRVKLWGKVRSWSQRGLAERTAWAAPGIREVEDHLTIG